MSYCVYLVVALPVLLSYAARAARWLLIPALFFPLLLFTVLVVARRKWEDGVFFSLFLNINTHTHAEHAAEFQEAVLARSEAHLQKGNQTDRVLGEEEEEEEHQEEGAVTCAVT